MNAQHISRPFCPFGAVPFDRPRVRAVPPGDLLRFWGVDALVPCCFAANARERLCEEVERVRGCQLAGRLRVPLGVVERENPRLRLGFLVPFGVLDRPCLYRVPLGVLEEDLPGLLFIPFGVLEEGRP